MGKDTQRLAMIVTDAFSFNVLYKGQLEHLRESGIEITLFCGGSGEDRARLEARKLGRVFYLPMRRKPHLVWDLLSLVWLSTLLMVKRFDAIVYSTPKALLLGALAAFVARQPCRTAIVHGRSYESSRGKARLAFLLLDRLAFACSHDVLFVSHSLRAAYEADDVRLVRKGRVLGSGSCNGVDLSRFRPAETKMEKDRLRTELSIPVEAFVVLTVGRMNRDKGLKDIARLIERLGPNGSLKWIFVGGVEDAESFAALEALNGHDLVHVGFSEEVERWFQVADLHLFLSHREGFGNVAIEAAACGVPTFAFDVVGVRDSVAHGATGILFDRKAGLDPIAQEIRAALADREQYAKRFSRARSIIAERYDDRSVWQRYTDAYMQSGGAQRRNAVQSQRFGRSVKRLLDIGVSALGLLLLSPVLAIVAVLISICMGAPVLFRQTRPGLHGQTFEMVKFRTMLDTTCKDGHPLHDSARLTSLGRFLRATSLDELPELWNVLKGDMSLVGPRPLLMEYLPLYSAEQSRRHHVRPGVTGWAQVNGRNAISWDHKLALDVWYVDNQSLWLDLKILYLTAKKVINREGVSSPGEATTTKFQGNA